MRETSISWRPGEQRLCRFLLVLFSPSPSITPTLHSPDPTLRPLDHTSTPLISPTLSRSLFLRCLSDKGESPSLVPTSSVNSRSVVGCRPHDQSVRMQTWNPTFLWDPVCSVRTLRGGVGSTRPPEWNSYHDHIESGLVRKPHDLPLELRLLGLRTSGTAGTPTVGFHL